MHLLISCLLLIIVPFGSANVQTNNVVNSSAPVNDWIDKVHVIFMNHLDVGYASFINSILNEYFQTYFSLAADIANQLRADGFVERFIYTTHPWIVYLYLNCPQNFVLTGVKLVCPTQIEIDKFLKAVRLGDITWHAGPMNMQPEFMESWLFGMSTDIAAQLDKDFNIVRPMRVLSQRDVPSMTQSVIPIMLMKGIGAVTVGVNPMTPPPAVPKIFRWEHGGVQVLATWHANGYPNDVGPVPSQPGGLSREDCAFVPGFKEALCFVFRTDNTGPPPNIQEVLSNYEILRANFPTAQLVASTLDDFFEALDSFKDKLPIVSKEFGDTWIQGIASDPKKNQDYMVASRILGHCLEAKNCSLMDARIWNASFFLLKNAEHTWGLNSEHDNYNWENAKFLPLHKKNQNFINSANSWAEQRNFTKLAIEALKDHPIKKTIVDSLDELKPSILDFKDWVKIADPSTHLKCPQHNLQDLLFSPDGSISSFVYNQVSWADSNHQLWKFVYNSYNETDYNNFVKLYDYNGNAGYFKNNLTANGNPQSKIWPAIITNLYRKDTTSGCSFCTELKMQDVEVVKMYGAPALIYMCYIVTDEGIEVYMSWINKTMTRFPEALSLSFRPMPIKGSQWRMFKVDQPIDPYNVILNGSQYNHATTGPLAFSYITPSGTWEVSSYHVPLLNVLVNNELSHVFPAPLSAIPSDTIAGFSFNIYNNIWETNYIMWYPYLDEDSDFMSVYKMVLKK